MHKIPVNTSLFAAVKSREGQAISKLLVMLRCMGLNEQDFKTKYNLVISEDLFTKPNQLAAEQLIYFLFDKLDSVKCHSHFRDCWPIVGHKDKAVFRKCVVSWMTEIYKNDGYGIFLKSVRESNFHHPVGDKFCLLLLKFATYVMAKMIMKANKSEQLAYPVDSVDSFCNSYRYSWLETLEHNAKARADKIIIETEECELSAASIFEKQVRLFRNISEQIKCIEESMKKTLELSVPSSKIESDEPVTDISSETLASSTSSKEALSSLLVSLRSISTEVQSWDILDLCTKENKTIDDLSIDSIVHSSFPHDEERVDLRSIATSLLESLTQVSSQITNDAWYLKEVPTGHLVPALPSLIEDVDQLKYSVRKSSVDTQCSTSMQELDKKADIQVPCDSEQSNCFPEVDLPFEWNSVLKELENMLC